MVVLVLDARSTNLRGIPVCNSAPMPKKNCGRLDSSGFRATLFNPSLHSCNMQYEGVCNNEVAVVFPLKSSSAVLPLVANP